MPSVYGLNFGIWEILDILIVSWILYELYKMLKGSIAINILIGIGMVYGFWWLVGMLHMKLLHTFLTAFVQIGVLILVIIFQPELRRFLLMIGNNAFRNKFGFFTKFFQKDWLKREVRQKHILAVRTAIVKMGKTKTGALVVLANSQNLMNITASGVTMNAEVSEGIILSIFQKESPLHDGAVIISDDKILAASCILPVSENPEIPRNAGLRHRAAIGITEATNAAAFIVSEETGKISFAHDGRLQKVISEEQLKGLLEEYY
jgi:diadenylate cyclase